jgi:hypothetical protein
MASRPPPPPPPRRAISTGTHRVQREQAQDGVSGVRTVANEFEHFVRINPQGEVVAAHGSAQRIAALSSYVCSLADAVGQLLEIGPCRVIEANYAGGRLVTVREADGSIVGAKPLTAGTSQPARAVRNGTGG